MYGDNDCVLAWTYAMSSTFFLVCSALLRFPLCDLWIDRGLPLSYNFPISEMQLRWGDEEGRFPEDFMRDDAHLYSMQKFFVVCLFVHTTSLEICLLVVHYSSSDWTVKAQWKAGERLWLYQAFHGDKQQRQLCLFPLLHYEVKSIRCALIWIN